MNQKRYQVITVSGKRSLLLLIIGLFGFFALGATAVSPKPVLAQTPGSDLTEDEITTILYMREEEKLAHDVYVMMSAQWGYPIFANIANAEQTHTEAVLQLMVRYGLEDAAANNPVGVFENADLQNLYDQLVAQGSQSLEDALLVGGLIEETDILDLQSGVALTDKPDIQFVFQNLLNGSSNHLRAFATRYEQLTGETYQPQALDQDAFASIMDAASGKGNGRRGGRRGGNQGTGNGGFGGKGW